MQLVIYGRARNVPMRPAPTTATSRGTGELVRAALDLGCRQVVLGIGGSACTDGGAGMVQALGGRLLDAAGAELGPGGAALADLDRLDLSGLDGISVARRGSLAKALTAELRQR